MANVGIYTVVLDKTIHIDHELLDKFNSVDSKTNRIGFYVLGDGFHLTTETLAKDLNVSLNTNLASLSALFASPNALLDGVTGERELCGNFLPHHAVGAAKLFNFLNQKIEKYNGKIHAIFENRFIRFLAAIPLVGSFVRSFFSEAFDLKEMEKRSIKAFFVVGKTNIATQEDNDNITNLVTERNDTTELNYLEVFNHFQKILPYSLNAEKFKTEMNDPTIVTRELALRKFIDLTNLYNTAKDNQKTKLDLTEKVNFKLTDEEWSKLSTHAQEVYYERLRQLIPQLSKAKSIREGNLQEAEEDSYTALRDKCNQLLRELALEDNIKRELPMILVEEVETAKKTVLDAYGRWQAKRVEKLKDQSVEDVLGSKDFSECQKRYRALMLRWGSNPSYESSRTILNNAYSKILLGQMVSLPCKKSEHRLPEEFIDAISLEELQSHNNRFLELLKDYKNLPTPKQYRPADEISAFVKEGYERTKERLCKALQCVRKNKKEFALSNKEAEAPKDPKKPLLLTFGTDKPKSVSIEKLQKMFSCIEQVMCERDDQAESTSINTDLGKEIYAEINKTLQSLCEQFVQHYAEYLKDNYQQIMDLTVKALPQSNNPFVRFLDTIQAAWKARFEEEKANFERAERQFSIVLFQEKASVISYAKDYKSKIIKELILPYMDKNYVDMFMDKEDAYKRSLALIELHKMLESDERRSIVDILDPNKELSENLELLEEKKIALMNAIATELRQRNEKEDPVTVAKIKKIQAYVETEWNKLLKEKYPVLFEYCNIVIDMNVDKSVSASLDQKKLILEKLAEYKKTENPASIKMKIVYVETLFAIAEQLGLAKQISSMGNFSEDSTQQILRNQIPNYYSASDETIRKHYVTLQYGIPFASTLVQIKKRYRHISIILHPDKRSYPAEVNVSKEVLEYIENKHKLLPKESFIVDGE
ncbi:MAG: J domain-containing protein [Parachlamydiales bacterium]|jgi:hypothetical protein